MAGEGKQTSEKTPPKLSIELNQTEELEDANASSGQMSSPVIEITECSSSENLEKSVDNIVKLSSDSVLNSKSVTSKPELSIVIPDDETAKTDEDVVFFIGDDHRTDTPLSPRENNFPFNNLSRHRKESFLSTDSNQNQREPIGEVEFVPPDGGFGWVVVISACICNCWIIGFVKCYGILYIEIMKEFPNSSAYHASWIPAMLSTIGLLAAPVFGVLCRLFTSRKVSFLGGILCSSGLFLSVFATSLSLLIFTIGIITGLGSGLTQIAGILISSLYFDKRRALASAVCVSGNAIGSFFMPPLMDYLLNHFGLRGTLLVISALMLHISAVSLFFRPIDTHAFIQEKDRRAKEDAKLSGNRKLDTKGSFLSRALSSRPSLEIKYQENNELTREVSFLRSASVLCSVPDLREYAKSWHVQPRMETKGNHLTVDPMSYHQPRFHGRTRTYSESVSGTVKANNLALKVSEGMDPRKCYSGYDIALNPQPRTRHAPHRRYAPVNRAILALTEEDRLNSKVSLPIKEEDEESLLEESEQPVVVVAEEDNDVKREEKEKTEPSKFQEIVNAMSKCFDVNLMRRPKLILFNLSVFLVSCGAPHCLFYVHAYSDSIGIDKDLVSTLLCISAAVDLVGRLGAGVIADADVIEVSTFYFISAMISGASTLCLPFVTTFTSMAIFLSFYGFGVGAWFVLLPTILAKTHGIKNLPATFGLMRFGMGVVNFASPQISGILIDVFDSYKPVYFFMGTSITLGGLLILVHPHLPCTEEEEEAKQSKNTSL